MRGVKKRVGGCEDEFEWARTTISIGYGDDGEVWGGREERRGRDL